MAKQKINSAQIQAQEGFINLTLSNSWTNYDTVWWDQVSYMKDSLGFVHVRGFCKGGTLTTGTLVATLPSGYRPAKNSYYAGGPNNAGAMTSWQISSTGEILILFGGSATYCSMGHMIFKAEN